MPEQPVAYLNLEVYEDSVNFVGVAKVSLPDITFKVETISGAGMLGDLEVPLIGMLENMVLGIDFLSTTDAAVKLMSPRKHQIDLRAAEENWNVEQAEVGTWADRFVFVAMPKGIKPGGIAPSTKADSSGEFDVYYYAAYRDGEQLWEIDKRSMKCVIGGFDYMAEVRKALGK